MGVNIGHWSFASERHVNIVTLVKRFKEFRMKTLLPALVIASAIAVTAARPQKQVLVTTTPQPSTSSVDDRIETPPERPPVITQFHVRSDVQFRYAKTVAESYVKNPNAVAGEVAFELVLPDTAFVSNFSMLIEGVEYVAEVDEKEEAQETYDREVVAGNNAGIVNQDTRDANLIRVSVNIAAHGKVRFRLTYEELLERRLGRYDQVIHVNPGQIVDDFRIDVFINESLPLSVVNVPELKTDPNSITSSLTNPNAIIEMDEEDDAKAHVTYKPNLKLQKLVNEKTGVSGQFIVQYDVDRKNQNGDVQVLDGYFVHYFAPDSLETLPKHVVFVLDVSGSMYGTKLQQTKDAMVTVIDDMTEKDYFNIITFSDEVYHWKPENEKLMEEPHAMTYQGNDEIKSEALSHVLSLETVGGTNINEGMLAALRLVAEVRRSETIPGNTKSMIIFLTDGQATTGVTGSEAIRTNIEAENAINKVPIYGLAFGSGADFNLMKTLSQENGAFARKIFEASDAAIQLEDFYLQIAGPKLQNVKIEYVGEAVKNETFTKTTQDTFNEGNEIVITGQIDENDIDSVEVIITGEASDGPVVRRLSICPMPKPMPLPLPIEVQEGEDQQVPFHRCQCCEDDPPARCQRLREQVPCDNLQFQALCSVSSGNTEDEVAALDKVAPLRPTYPIFPGDGCIPFPSPKPREPTSEAQNFVERLWAYKTIKELLKKSDDEEKDAKADDEDVDVLKDESDPVEEEMVEEEDLVSLDPPKKSSKQKAMDLSLRYNFVTPLTSLVVTKPKKIDTEDGEEEEDPVLIVDPVPVRSGFGGYGGFGGFKTLSAGGPVHRKTAVFALGGPPGGAFGVGSSGPFRKSGPPGAYGRPAYSIAAAPPPRTTTFQPSFAMASFDSVDYDDDYAERSASAESASTFSSTPTTCDGSISLHDKTYLRGLNITVTDDVDNLTVSPSKISQKLTSLEVQGDCCWTIFKEALFEGESKRFSPGASKSAGDMGAVFRAAGSVKKSVC